MSSTQERVFFDQSDIYPLSYNTTHPVLLLNLPEVGTIPSDPTPPHRYSGMFTEWTVLWHKLFSLCNLRRSRAVIFGYLKQRVSQVFFWGTGGDEDGLGSWCLNMLFFSKVVELTPEHLSHFSSWFFPGHTHLLNMVYREAGGHWSELEFLRVSIHKRERLFLSFLTSSTEFKSKPYKSTVAGFVLFSAVYEPHP